MLNPRYRTGPRKMARALITALDRYIQSEQFSLSPYPRYTDHISLSLPQSLPRTSHSRTDCNVEGEVFVSDTECHSVNKQRTPTVPIEANTKGSQYIPSAPSTSRSPYVGGRLRRRISYVNPDTNTGGKYLLVDDNKINLKVRYPTSKY